MVALVVIGTLLVLVGGSCALMIHNLNNMNLGESEPRRHLAPIPVSPSVCPYVRVMHAAANTFERTYLNTHPLAAELAGVTTTSGPQVQWPAQKARLAQSLNVLELAVVASEGRFPPRVRRRFDVVVKSIRTGRAQLASAKGPLDLLMNSYNVYGDGETAFGDASDLIGDACAPVHLAADPAA